MRARHCDDLASRGNRQGFSLRYELPFLVGTLALLAGIIVPAVAYMMFLDGRQTCSYNLISIGTANTPFYSGMPPPPTPWVEGKAWDPATKQFALEPSDAYEKSRLALWRLVADQAVRDANFGLRNGTASFICPTAVKGAREVAEVGSKSDPAKDFQSPYDQLYYSLSLQTVDGRSIPYTGTGMFRVVAGDRSLGSRDGSRKDGDLVTNGGPDANNSANHTWGGYRTGQNVLYSVGRISWQDVATCGIDEDDIYLIGGQVPTGTSAPAPGTEDTDTCLMPVCAD
jgi:hypothetical protein